MLPNVKSSWEQGFKDLEASTWFSFMAPKGTPEAVIKKLHDATVTAMEDKEVQKQMLASGAIIVPPERRSTEYLKGLHGEGDREERRADPRRRPVDRIVPVSAATHSTSAGGARRGDSEWAGVPQGRPRCSCALR